MEEDNIIIICRHGERIDCSSERNNQKTMKGDPELTETGINLSKYLGQRIYTEFKPYIEQNRIKLFVSPFTRTLETAISLRNEMQMNLSKTNQDFYIIKNLGEANFYNFDLYPNICAVYVNEKYRNNGIAGKLLNLAVEEMKKKGVSPIYLVTDHVGFYERYGFEFYTFVKQEDGESRLYIHR